MIGNRKSVKGLKGGRGGKSGASGKGGRGAKSARIERDAPMRDRMIVLILAFFALFAIFEVRLFYLGKREPVARTASVPDISLVASRPPILDRSGAALALDIPVRSLFAEPRRIENPDEIYESLVTVFPALDFDRTMRRLRSGSAFVWLRREITPAQQQEVLALGLPGIGFRDEIKRFYPSGTTMSHILGHTNIDNQGIAGIEKYLDDSGLRALHGSGFAAESDLKSVRLSLDLRVQHYVRDALNRAMEKYRAIAAAGLVIDVHTGEIIALSSLPDYDPNRPVDALKKDRLNRITAGVFEMGSTFKTITTAMALDSEKVHLHSRFDATRPLRYGRFTIDDFHAKKRVLSVPEVFVYSSNIGTAKMAQEVGIENHRAFLKKLGLLDKVKNLELPEIAGPVEPKRWSNLSSITVSYGHGISTTPLQTAYAVAALVNGGKLLAPTLLPRSKAQADKIAVRAIAPQTSDEMRYLLWLNAIKGSGRNAQVAGLWVGGKTGTAEKVVNGKYDDDKRFNTFIAAFPIHAPRYLVLVILDEPQVEEGEVYATAGMNAAPTAADIIRRSALVLGVEPNFDPRTGSQIAALGGLGGLGGADEIE